MRLILVALNIARVENTWTRIQNIQTHVANNSIENPKNDNSPLEYENKNMEKKMNEDLVIEDIVMAKKVGNIWVESVSRSWNKL